MKTSTYGNCNGLNDLLILPESSDERKKIEQWLDACSYPWGNDVSNVQGQDWYGQSFIVAYFGEILLIPLQKALKAMDPVAYSLKP